MSTYRHDLPQLADTVFLTDGGLETTLIFIDGLDLPDFAAFHLLTTPEGHIPLSRYFDTYAALARRDGVGIVLETPTWRASADWGARLGHSAEALHELNRRAVALVEASRRHETSDTPIVISGCVGPRGDGYTPGDRMTPTEAAAYHAPQIRTFAGTAVDMIGALTMNYTDEAIGIVRAAEAVDVPVAISFTVETDGALPSGQPLGEAVEAVDVATGAYPTYYMVNCAHPTHFEHVLSPGEPWMQRIRCTRANASALSHAELDEADTLDSGDPHELAGAYVRLRQSHPQLTVLGGCCGTDDRHVAAISSACRLSGTAARAGTRDAVT